MKKEENLQLAVCNYLRLQYPTVIFTSESSGIRLTMGQAVKLKKLRSSNALPDLLILHPMNGYHGLFLELKSKSPYLKNGELSSDKHIQEQNEVIIKLMGRGYYAQFAYHFESAKRIIDWYFAGAADFNKDNPEGLRLSKIQESLFTIGGNALDTVLRVSKKNPLVTDGVIKVKLGNFLGNKQYISKFNKKTYLGKCSTCLEMCGVKM